MTDPSLKLVFEAINRKFDDTTVSKNKNSDNDFLEDIRIRTLKEIIKHFKNKEAYTYKNDEDSRYVFNKRDLNYIMDCLENEGINTNSLKVVKILDDCDEFFCYEIKRNKKAC